MPSASSELKALEPERVTARQIEAARRALTRHMKRAGRVWIRVFPDVPVSKKPLEVRMGSGKGAPELWVVRVKPGRIIFEIDGVSETIGARGARARGRQAADQDALRRAHRGIVGADDEAGDARAMTVDQLDDEALRLKKEQFNLRFQRATGQLENTSRVREVRRDIARIKTIAAQKRARGPANRRVSEDFKMPKRTLQGVVVSDKQDKTVVVRVERRYTHPVMKKTVRRTKKYYAHDETNEYGSATSSGSRSAGRCRGSSAGK